ncbi:MAG: hypothetical protein ABSD02_15535 [Steroidobacteraceae bacterium]|jgi:hypothetical protein
MAKLQEAGDRARFVLQVAVERWGAPGVGALFLGVGFVLFAIFWLLPARDSLAALKATRLAALTLPAREPSVEVRVKQPAELLRVFNGSFPPQTLILTITDQLNRAASESGLGITQADYRLNSDPSGLVRYEVALTSHATYPQVRRFVAACITRFPTLSLDGLSMSRTNATDPTIDAQFRLSIYVAGD